MDDWIARQAAAIAARAREDLAALVAISSPSGDVEGAERCFEACAAMLPAGASIQRVACSSPDHAPDFIARLTGSGTRRVMLLGHVDTVVAHEAHRPLTADAGGTTLIGSGSVDMKGGVVLALGALRAFAERPELYEELALVLVCDEEWRTEEFVHTARFAHWDACLCFEAGERTPEGDEGVVVKRKAAGTLHIRAVGRSAHSGSAPDRGQNALLALAHAAQVVAGAHDPHGPARLTSVPTVMRAGDAFNVVPGDGELWCDLRSDSLAAIEEVVAGLPTAHAETGALLAPAMLRRWPGMDSREAVAGLLGDASARLGRDIVGVGRGGASDASHFASAIPLTVDGLGPRGGSAHHPDEFVLVESIRSRAEVALAVVEAALAPAAPAPPPAGRVSV